MIIGKNKVTEWVRYNKTPYWRIKRSESEQHMVVNSGDEENIPLEESISRLSQAFGIMSPGNYFIEAWTTKGQTKNWNRDHFQILPDSNDYLGSAQLQQIAQQTQPSVDIATEVQKGIDKYKTEIELQDLRRKVADLERENKELTSGIESTLSRVYNKVEPYLGMILNVKEPAGVAVGSVQADDAQRRLEKAFEIWQENEPDVLVMVEKIANMSKTDKGTYTMARNFLTGK
jgi:hypothetical protein